MKFNETTKFLSIFLTVFVHQLFIPGFAQGDETLDTSVSTTGSNSENNHHLEDNHKLNWKELHFESYRYSTSRLLPNDDTCLNVCNTENIRQFREPLEKTTIVLKVDTTTNDNVDSTRTTTDRSTSIFHTFVGRVTGFFENMGGLFKFFTHRTKDDQQLMIPTELIVPLIAKRRSKVNSLISTIRQTSHNNSSTTSTFVKMLYELSVENMISVLAVLDPILNDTSQNNPMDVTTVGCHLTQISTLLNEYTIPNIEFIAQLLYTQSNNTEMTDHFYKYKASKKKRH
jgi:hypothetical protein